MYDVNPPPCKKDCFLTSYQILQSLTSDADTDVQLYFVFGYELPPSPFKLEFSGNFSWLIRADGVSR